MVAKLKPGGYENDNIMVMTMMMTVMTVMTLMMTTIRKARFLWFVRHMLFPGSCERTCNQPQLDHLCHHHQHHYHHHYHHDHHHFHCHHQ